MGSSFEILDWSRLVRVVHFWISLGTSLNFWICEELKQEGLTFIPKVTVIKNYKFSSRQDTVSRCLAFSREELQNITNIL